VITAVDTSILLDILLPDPVFGSHSKNALRSAMAGGQLVACDSVFFSLDPRQLGIERKSLAADSAESDAPAANIP
jgi:hypothetical protein